MSVVKSLHFIFSEDLTSQTGARDSWVCSSGVETQSQRENPTYLPGYKFWVKIEEKKALKNIKTIQIQMRKKIYDDTKYMQEIVQFKKFLIVF